MAWLAGLLGRSRPTGNVPDAATCPHDTLTPRWRNRTAMDGPSAPMGYVCHRCHSEFLPAQAPHRTSRHADPPDAPSPAASDDSP